jgi:hypothetical protein
MKQCVTFFIASFMIFGCTEIDSMDQNQQSLEEGPFQRIYEPLPELSIPQIELDRQKASDHFLSVCAGGDQLMCQKICHLAAESAPTLTWPELENASIACSLVEPTPVADFETFKCIIDYFLSFATFVPTLDQAREACSTVP